MLKKQGLDASHQHSEKNTLAIEKVPQLYEFMFSLCLFTRQHTQDRTAVHNMAVPEHDTELIIQFLVSS